MAAKVYPLAVYTADHGLAWTYPRGEIAFAELDACRTAFGPLPDFDAGDKGFEGVWARGDKVFVLRCQSVSAWDFRGRDATYLAVTWMDRVEAAATDFERLLAAEALRVPAKNPPPFFEVDAETNECPTVADPDPILKDGFASAGAIIAGQPADAVVAIKRTEGSRLASCSVRSPSVAPFATLGIPSVEGAPSAPPTARPDLSPVVLALSVALFLSLALATALGFKWWQTEKELDKVKEEFDKVKVELRRLQGERDGRCDPWRLMDFYFDNYLIHTF